MTRLATALAGIIYLALISLGQAQMQPSGQFTPGHTVRCLNSVCTVVGDAGPALGSTTTGANYLTEIGITNTGTPFCINDALINSPSGYHQFCVGTNATIQGQNGAFLTYNAYGGATPLGLWININGTNYPFPGPGSGDVLGPSVSVVGDIPLWNNTGGTLLNDSGVALSSLAPLASPAFTGTPTAPTAAAGTNTTQIATTAFADAAAAAAVAAPTTTSITSATSLSSASCGHVILAGGSSFYTITMGAASGFTANCSIKIVNTDAGAGKTLAVTGLTSGGFGYSGCGVGNICPGQSIEYVGTGSVWILSRNPEAWRPTSAPTLHASTAGVNTNDCLSSGTPCTLPFVCIARAMIDPSGNSQSNDVNIQIADGTYTASSGGVACQITGNYGASSSGLTFINGDNATPSNVILLAPANGTALFTKDLGETEISNLEVAGAGSTGISGAQFSVVDLLGGMVFGCMGTLGNTLQFSQSASLNVDDSFTVLGPCTQGTFGYLSGNANVIVATGGVTGTISGGTISYTSGFFANQGGYWNVANIAFAYSAGGAATGAKLLNYALGSFGPAAGGCFYTGGTPPQSFIPGNEHVAIPITMCTDFSVSDTVANLPACNSGTGGGEYFVTDSTTNTWGASISGSGSDSVFGICNTAGYTVFGR